MYVLKRRNTVFLSPKGAEGLYILYITEELKQTLAEKFRRKQVSSGNGGVDDSVLGERIKVYIIHRYVQCFG